MHPNIISWGVIGCGQIASDKTIPALLATPNARLVAYADALPAARERIAKLAPQATGHVTAASLLADPFIQAVYIAAPTGQHRELVLAAAAAGKHILCEKPLATSLDDSEVMRAACARAGVRLMVAYMSRFGDHFQRARELVAAGHIGAIQQVRASFSYDARNAYPLGSAGAWRWTDPVGGGPMLDIGIYLLFALREIIGQELTLVSAGSWNVGTPVFAQNDTVVAWFRTRGGISGLLSTGFTHSESVIEIIGSTGRLVLDNIFSQSPSGTLTVTMGDARNVMTADPATPHWELYRREVAHFSSAILDGTPHAADVSDALMDQRVIAAINTSLSSCQPVAISPAVWSSSATSFTTFSSTSH